MVERGRGAPLHQGSGGLERDDPQVPFIDTRDGRRARFDARGGRGWRGRRRDAAGRSRHEAGMGERLTSRPPGRSKAGDRVPPVSRLEGRERSRGSRSRGFRSSEFLLRQVPDASPVPEALCAERQRHRSRPEVAPLGWVQAHAHAIEPPLRGGVGHRPPDRGRIRRQAERLQGRREEGPRSVQQPEGTFLHREADQWSHRHRREHRVRAVQRKGRPQRTSDRRLPECAATVRLLGRTRLALCLPRRLHRRRHAG